MELGLLWTWIVWIVIGGFAGAIADRIIQGNQLGVLGNILIGIVGGLLGGALLGWIGVTGQGIVWTFVAALFGASILLLVARLLTDGRGIGRARRRSTV